MSLENVQFYKFSLLRNVSQVENQSLHCNCTSPTVLQEVEDSRDQDGSEEVDDEGDMDWVVI